MSETGQSILDAAFWSNFAKTIWEQKHTVFKNAHSSITELDETEVFRLLVSYSDRCRKNKNSDGLKFYVHGDRLHEQELLQILPKKSDRSLTGYHERMQRFFEDYCLVCDELLQVNLAKQDLLLEFTDSLYREVGIPNRFAEMGLYLGNYRKTPFGVHVDGCGVFSLPVVGVKKFRIWEADFVEQNPKLVRAFQYAKFKNDSELLVAEPGDIAYWPSKAWHIAESDGSFSATWSLGVWVDRAHRDFVSNAFSKLIDQKLGADAFKGMIEFEHLADANGRVSRLPKILVDSARALQTISKDELEQAFLKDWMLHISKQGLKTSPFAIANRKLTIASGDCIRLSSLKTPILWLQADPRSERNSGANLDPNSALIQFVYDGEIVVTSTSDRFLKLVQALNDGKVCRISRYISTKKNSHDLESIRTLAEAGALTLVPQA